jgi:redox-regulated HSP33 family molecular chaperone
LAAIEQAARGVPGVRYAAAFEDVDAYGQQTGYVSLAVTDQYTDALAVLTSPVASYQEQSQQLAERVALAVDQARAAGIYVATIVAQVVLQPVTLRLRVKAGFDTASVSLQARSVCVQTVNALAPGAELTVAALEAALANVNGLFPSTDTVALPVATVVPTPLQVIRTNLQLVVAG